MINNEGLEQATIENILETVPAVIITDEISGIDEPAFQEALKAMQCTSADVVIAQEKVKLPFHGIHTKVYWKRKG